MSMWICHKIWRIRSSQNLHMMCGEDRRLPSVSAQNNEWNKWLWHICVAAGMCILSAYLLSLGILSQHHVHWKISGISQCEALKCLYLILKKFTFHRWRFLEYVILLIIPLWIFREIEELISTHKHWLSTISVVFHIVSHLTQSQLGMFFSPVYTNVLQSGKLY